jgi:GT2 family glycosyltransferase
MKNNKSVSAIICVHTSDRWQSIHTAVSSVKRQTYPVREIIIVVDTNDELAMRLKASVSGVTVISNQQAPGLSGARNTGVATASGDLLFFLDDDAAAEPQWLEKVVQNFADEHVLGVTSKIIPAWRGQRPAWFPNEFLWVVGCTYDGMKPGIVRNLLGASMCLSRTAFEAAGGFNIGLGRTNKGLPMGGEETEFCIRATKAIPGGRLIFDDNAYTTHQVNSERLTWKYFFRRCYAEGLSKAHLTSLTPSSTSLSVEREYSLKVLPLGMLRALQAALQHGELSGFARAAAIDSGFSCTCAGYFAGKSSAILLNRFGSAPSTDMTIGDA